MPKTVRAPLTVAQSCRAADACIPHARTCKKSPHDCPQCQANIAWFASLPLGILAVVLSDRSTRHT
jgi:hypothetical protein